MNCRRQDVDKETEEEEEQEVDRSNLARIVNEPFGKPIPGKQLRQLHLEYLAKISSVTITTITFKLRTRAVMSTTPNYS